ncbi:MAG TPA: hypothetical protein VKB80_32745 [Kofleriaceae bacterium]|nr:hypothetical protein [Kofleriaceae bacterium]
MAKRRRDQHGRDLRAPALDDHRHVLMIRPAQPVISSSSGWSTTLTPPGQPPFKTAKKSSR